MHRVIRRNDGNVAIVIIVLLLAGGAAYFFLFREVKEPELPSAAESGQTVSNPAVPSVRPAESSAVEAEDMESTLSRSGAMPEGLPMTADGAVDWDARREQLQDKYSSEFSEPKIGTSAKVLLRSGRAVEGRITDLNKETVTLRITGTGKATYQRSQLSPASQLVLFKDVFVNYSAEKELASEKAARQAEAVTMPQ